VNFKILTTSILIAIVAGVLGLSLYINHRESLLLDGQVQVPVLQHPVQIYFDQLSIPYMEARSEKDLTIAQGFVTASQRLFQMDMLRRIAKGEMSAIFGGNCLANDKLARILGFRRIAEAEYPLLAPETKNWLKSYSQGVNAYISQGKLPLEFILLGFEPQPWQPEDSLAILKYLQYASDECWQVNVLQDAIAQKAGIPLAKQMFWPAFKPSYLSVANLKSQPEQSHPISPEPSQEIEKPNIGPKTKEPTATKQQPSHQSVLHQLGYLPAAAQLSWGSTGWVISKNLSQSKGSLLACDKHTLFNFPDLFFLSSLRAPFMHIAGLSIPGVPGILIGRNDSVSWSAICLKKRSQELCLEQFSNQFPDQYQNSRGSFKAKEVEEEIAIRLAPNRVEKVILTKDGPLLTKTGQAGIALNWYGFNPANNVIESIRLINKAKNWSDFSIALEKYQGNLQTFLYTDITGNIGQYIAGYNRHLGQISSVARQAANQEDGQTSEQTDFIVANDGRLSAFATANNIVNSMPSGNSWATVRVCQILESNSRSKTKLSLEDMIALQSDTKAPLSELVMKTISNALIETKNIDQYERDAVAMLSAWDGQLKGNSVCASIYESFLIYLTKQILQAQIGESLANEYINKWPYWTQFTAHILDKQPAHLLPATQRGFAPFCLNCLSQSLKDLRLIFHTGTLPGHLSDFQWEKLHQLDFRKNITRFIPPALVNMSSPLLPQTIGIGGDQDCLNACNYQISDQSPFYICNSGPTARLLIDMADNDKFYHSLPFGQSGHLFCRDRIDDAQLKSWRNVEFHAIAFSSKELERIVRHNLTLDTPDYFTDNPTR